MQDDLLIVQFENRAEEIQIVSTLQPWAPVVGRVAVANADEAKQLSAIAKRCGRRSRLVVPAELDHLLPALFENSASMRRPDVVIVSKCASPMLRDLVVAMFGDDTLTLEDLSAQDLAVRDISTALVLWNVTDTRGDDLTAALQVLNATTCTIGFLPCFGTALDRFMLMKVLSFPDIPNSGAEEVISSFLPGRGPSGSIPNAAITTGELLRSEMDFLAIQGHGNPLDTFLSEQAILCAAASQKETQAPEVGGLFNCFHGGTCFRQTGRWPTAERVPGSEVNALALFAHVCRFFQFDERPFNRSHGLAPQIMSGPVIATVTSPGPVWTDNNLFILGLAMIREGQTFAEVARSLHDLHDRHLGYETGLPAHIPSILAFGSPIARMRPRVVPVARRDRVNGPIAVVTLDALTTCQDTIVRVELSEHETTAKLAVHGLWLGARVKSARAHWDRACLYLFIQGSHPDRDVEIQLTIIDQQASVHFLEDVQRSLGFWPHFLDAVAERREESGKTAKDIQECLLAVIRARRILRNYLNDMEGSQDVELARLSRLDHSIKQEVSNIQGLLLRTATDILMKEGVGDHAMCGPLLSSSKLGPTGPCACGHGEIRTQEFRSNNSDSLPIFKHTCGCNDAGYDSAALQVQWIDAPLSVQPGQLANLNLNITSEPHKALTIASNAIIASFSRNNVAYGSIEVHSSSGGKTVAICCSVPVPEDFPRGLCELSFLAIVNGALAHRSFLANVG